MNATFYTLPLTLTHKQINFAWVVKNYCQKDRPTKIQRGLEVGENVKIHIEIKNIFIKIFKILDIEPLLLHSKKRHIRCEIDWVDSFNFSVWLSTHLRKKIMAKKLSEINRNTFGWIRDVATKKAGDTKWITFGRGFIAKTRKQFPAYKGWIEMECPNCRKSGQFHCNAGHKGDGLELTLGQPQKQ